MNHKNFSVYTCSHLLVALKLQSTTFDRLSISSRYRLSLISSSNFTSLSFLKLIKELVRCYMSKRLPTVQGSRLAIHREARVMTCSKKEVFQPHLPVRLPCYDFTPVTNPALGRCFQMVSSRTSGVVDFHGVTGGVYKTRERIQRSVLICVY